jgi:flagellar assembly protein FliH
VRSEKPSPEVEFARKLAEVEQQAERRVREARQAGIKEGEQAGRKAAEGEMRATIEKLAAAIHETAALRPGIMARAEATLVKLAIAIARRVLHREMSVDPDALQALVHLLLQKVQAQEVLRVRIFPEHQAMLRAALERLPGGSQIEIRPDASLGRGGVLFETTRGTLDAGVDTQLGEVERGLTDRLHKCSP